MDTFTILILRLRLRIKIVNVFRGFADNKEGTDRSPHRHVIEQDRCWQ